MILEESEVPYPDVGDKLFVDIVSLHLLTHQVGDSAQDGIDSGDLAVPGEQCGDALAINAGGLGASVDVLRVISIMARVYAS